MGTLKAFQVKTELCLTTYHLGSVSLKSAKAEKTSVFVFLSFGGFLCERKVKYQLSLSSGEVSP